MKIIRILWILVLTACASQEFEVKDLAKSDVDLVADTYVQVQEGLLKQLLVKLYKRNPRELAKAPDQSIDDRLLALFGPSSGLHFAELSEESGTDSMLLAFDESYKGDRVFALVAGMTGMIRQSWNGQREFFLVDSLDEQKLYNGARNIEIVSWRLRSRTKSNGKPFLLAHGSRDDLNLSFVRIFAKLTAHQDMMARIVAQRHDRTINRVVHAIATTAFFPI